MLCDIKDQLDNPTVRFIMASSAFDPSPEVMEYKAKEFHRHESWQLFGWFENGEIVGVCGFEVHKGYVEILNIAVAESVHHHGVGGKMITALWKKYEMAIEAETDDDAVDFYRKRGFITTAIQKYNVRRWTCVLAAPKPLDQITDEERARLFPVVLSDYNPSWLQWFTEEKENLPRLIGADNIARISHYGSTSVPGLTAKPTVDILLEINKDTDIDKLKAALPYPEYICLNPPTTPSEPPHLMFLKGYTSTGFADKVYHIHVRYPGNWDELYFRDYLIAHPEIAAEYATLKARLHKDFEYSRDGYTDAKSAFIRAVTEKASALLGGSYIKIAIESDLHDILDIDPFRRADSIRHAIMRGECYIAVYDGVIRGFAILNYTFFDNGFIELLIAAEKYRRCGVGSALLNHLFAVCKTQKLFTSTNRSNEPMRNLLEKSGYTFCGQIDALDEGDPEFFFCKTRDENRNLVGV